MLDFKPKGGFSHEAKLTFLMARWIASGRESSGIGELLTQRELRWHMIAEFFSYHELLSLAYPYIRKYSSSIPDEICDLLKKSYYYCLDYVPSLWEEFLYIASALQEKGILLAPLKGIAFIADSMYGNNAYLRPMKDIDILIQKKDLPLVEEMLETLGYQKDLLGLKEDYWRNYNYHFEFGQKDKKRRPCALEVHWALDYKRNKAILPFLWGRVRRYHQGSVAMRLLSNEDTLFCLALHQRRFGKMLCLKNVCDTAVLLHRHDAELEWDYILREAIAGQMRTTLYFLLIQARLLLETPVPSSVFKSLNIPAYKKKLIERMVLGNVFSCNMASDGDDIEIKDLFLKTHILCYDNIREPVTYILNIPQEQFAKFYGLQPYVRKTNFLYRMRYLYFLCNLIIVVSKAIIKLAKKYYCSRGGVV